jgi:hypothetical protein
MNEVQSIRLAQITPPAAAVNGAAFVCAEIDTLDFDYMTIVVQLGAIAANMAVLQVLETDVTGQNLVAVPGTVFGNAATLNIAGAVAALPVTPGDANTFQVVQLDLRARRRFIQLAMTAGAGDTFASAFAILSRAKAAPITLAGHNTNELVRV